MSAVITSRLPYHTERIDGREVLKPLPKKPHSLAQNYLLITLNQFVPHEFQVMPELNVLCGMDRLVPDVVIAPRDAYYEDGDLADPAVLCVEILSPGQTLANLFDKVRRLTAAGTPECWVVLPEERQAWVCTAQEKREAHDVLSIQLSGQTVSIQLDLLFESLS